MALIIKKQSYLTQSRLCRTARTGTGQHRTVPVQECEENIGKYFEKT